MSLPINDLPYLKLRDVINVTQTTLKKNNEPLDLNDEYYAIREAIVQAELLLLRMINFKVQVEHPHKYLLHYLKSLKEWFSPDVWERYPVAETSWSILQDFYHDPSVVRLDNALISLACIKVALQSFGIAVPYSKIDKPWHSVFHPKGQLISKLPFGVFKLTKTPTKFLYWISALFSL